MAGTKQVEVTPEAAQRLGEPIEKAQREAERRDMLRQVNELEYTLVKTRDALRVIARGLEDTAEKYASPEAGNVTRDDLSLLYGAVNLLDCVAADCDRAYMGEARA